nr:MATE family efflux transporter [Spirochaetales bacterium]
GFQPIAGYNYGAKRFDRVRQSLKTTVLTALAVSLAGYAFMMLAPRAAIGLFTADAELIASSARVLRVMVLFIPLASLQITGSTYFQAVGKKTQSMMLGLSRQFLLLIPIVLILPLFIGVDGVWLAFPIADLASTVITLALLARELRHLESRSA